MYLRAYSTSDLPALFLLDSVCFEPPFRFSREAMRRFAEAKNALVRLACEPPPDGGNERVGGFCIVHLERGSSGLVGYVVTLDVAPECRRRGIGPALMDSVEVLAGDAGAKAMALHVWGGNDAAIRLYDRLGYTYVRTAEGFYGPGLDALVYRKPIRVSAQRLDGDDRDWRVSDGSSRSAS